MGRLLVHSVFAASWATAIVFAEYTNLHLKVHRHSYSGVGFASYRSPVLAFGGTNGAMPIVGYGAPIGPHVVPNIARRRRSVEDAGDTGTEPSGLRTAVHTLVYRNDTMCLGLAICQKARSSASDAGLLKKAFGATKDLMGVNFVEYAVAQASFPRETCEDAFVPCVKITDGLRSAIGDVLRTAADLGADPQKSPQALDSKLKIP